MRTGWLAGAVVLMLALGAPGTAHAGPLPPFTPCPDQRMTLRSDADMPRFRAAVVCVIGRVRRTLGLNVLRRDVRLERAGQKQAAHRAKIGFLGHSGEPNIVIPRQIKAEGYTASAVNEGIGWGDLAATTPFEVVGGMMVQYDACAQIQDPRFRDVGVGLAHKRPGESFDGNPNLHVTVEYGLKASMRPPKVRRRAVTCPRRLTGGPAKQGDSIADRFGGGAEGRPTPRGWAVIDDDTAVKQYIACVGRTSCTFDYAIRLHNTGPARMTPTQTIPAGARFPLFIHFGAEEIQAELATPSPAVELIIDDVVVATIPLYPEVNADR